MHIESQQEDDAMVTAATRTLEQDIHASVSADVSDHRLQLRQISGTSFVYYVNGKNQLIRYQRNTGGIAVVADRIQAVAVQVRGEYVELNIHMKDGISVALGAFVDGEQS